jgi:hypothetical protein
MRKETHSMLLSGLMCLLNEKDREMCQRIASHLIDLGYVPQRQKVQGYILAFKNNQVNQTIAKIGIRAGKKKETLFSIKFYACKNPPEIFAEAIQNAVLSTNGQYECCGCNLCGAAANERGYRCTYPEGTDFIRCGAYVVEIPCLAPEDINDFNHLLTEQHHYFLTRHTPVSAEGSK